MRAGSTRSGSVSSRRVIRFVIALVVSAIGLVAMARLSAAPVAAEDSGSARIRLSWSARPERIETCRVLSKEELEEREEHMRQRVECEGRFATYALEVMVDDRVVHRSIVRGGGLRNDRPIYLLREVGLAPGTHEVHVSFRRREQTDDDAAAFDKSERAEQDSGIFAGRAKREVEERARRARAAVPPKLELEATLGFAPGEVVVVTLDSERAKLAVLRSRTN